MKKMLLSAIAAAVALPSLAQGGYPFNPTYAEDHNIYYGLRLGWALATVNSDDDVLDGGSARSGLNIGAVIGFQLAPAAPVYLETGLSYTEKGGEGRVDGNKFTYDVAPRPGKYTMQQGTDIYMFNHATADQKAAAFKYIKFLVSKSSQLKWANATGYIPVNESVVTSSEYKNNKSTKLPAKLEDSMKHLYSVPVSKNSNAAYQQLNSIMQNILSAAQKGQNVNSQINAGKQKFDAAWKQ